MTFLPRSGAVVCGCDSTPDTGHLISIEEALALISKHVRPVPGSNTLPIGAARGRVLSAPVRARADMPRFDHSAMDGYALRVADLAGDGPWRLPVTGRIAAGESGREAIPDGGAVRIFTGAPIPNGAITVIMQEAVKISDGCIEIAERPRQRQNIRARGEEHTAGTVVLPKGTLLTSRGIAACVSAGVGDVDVKRRLRVTLLVSGSEITTVGTKRLSDGEIWDVNTPMLVAALDRPDLEVLQFVSVRDNAEALKKVLGKAQARSDLIISTGGVSVGEEDHLRSVMLDLGGRSHFAGVAIKPGKPVSFAQLGAAVWLGLPGNPQAAFVTWLLFGGAVVDRLNGACTQADKRRKVVLAGALQKKPGRCELRTATFDGCDDAGRSVVSCDPTVHSGQVAALAGADGLVFLPRESDGLPKGALVDFLQFCQD